MGNVSASASGSGGSVVSIINTVIIVLFIVFIVWEMLHGLRRGIFRQITHTACMLLAAVGAFVLTKLLWNGALDKYPTTESLLAEVDGIVTLSDSVYSVALEFDVEILRLLLALPMGVLVLPLVFTLIFAVLNLLVKLIYLIIRLIFHIKRGRGPAKRLTGLLLGAIEGAIVASIILLPAANIADIGSEISGAFVSGDEVSAASADEGTESEGLVDTIGGVLSNPILKIVNAVGGRAVCGSFATVEIDGEKVNLKEEMISLLNLYAGEANTLAGADFSCLTSEQRESLETLVLGAVDSPYLSKIAAELISGFATAIDNGDIPLEVEAPYNFIIDEAVAIFKTSSTKTLPADAETLLNVYFILDESRVIESIEGGGAVDVLVTKNSEGKTVIDRLVDEMNANERTRGLVTALTKLSLSILSSQVTAGADTTEIYESVKADLNSEVLKVKKEDYGSEDEYMDALSESVDTVLTDIGVELEPEIVEGIAGFVDENFISQGITELDDTQINDIILSYYDYYLEHQSNLQ